MANFASIIESIKQLEKYSERSQVLTVILNSFQGKKKKLTEEDKKELSDFAFAELEGLIDLIPTVQTYEEKDAIFGYEDQLLGIVMLCYSSPADIAENELNKIKALQEIVNQERFIENAIDDIFGQGNNEKDNVERLLCALIPLKDEFQKGQFYQGMLHYQQNIKALPDDSRGLLAEYISSELKRYLNDTLDEEILNNLEIACDVCKYFINDTLTALLYEVLKLGRSNINYYALATLLAAKRTVDADVIIALANDMEYAELTYGLLKNHGLTKLFPAELATEEYLAKSSMVRWLVYPTELGKQPDEIEYLGRVKKKEEYHIFRFRSDSNNLDDEIKGKWMIGWSSEEGGTFSNFDLYENFEQKTIEKTLKNIKKRLL